MPFALPSGPRQAAAVTEGPPEWRRIAREQGGLLTRAQLRACGITPGQVAHRVKTERWQRLAPTVIATFTGPLSREHLQWLAVLHAGDGSILGGATAAEAAGLRNWVRDEVTVLVPYANEVPGPIDGVAFVRTRRSTSSMRARDAHPPRARLEPAILLFGAADRSERTAQAILAAAVQQQLTAPTELREWIDRLQPLRRARLLKQTLDDIEGGSQSLAELDIRRMCRTFGIARPARQVKRRDASGRLRYTDCEWRLPDGRTLILEVDGGFHMDVDHWEDDLARQRALAATDRIIVRCTAREARDDPARVARDLKALGVPRAA